MTKSALPEAAPAGATLLQDLLSEWARRRPDRIALVCDGQRLTYAEIDARSNAVAHTLVSRGVRRGDRVVVFADNTPEAVVSYWAVLKARAVACILTTQLRAEKLGRLLEDSRASALIASGSHAATFAVPAKRSPHLLATLVSGDPGPERSAGLPGFVRWNEALAADRGSPPAGRSGGDDLATIIYTSGTTGEPKGVMLTHRNMLTASASIAASLGADQDDVVLAVLPLALSYGLYQMIVTFRTGGRLVLERSFAFPGQVLRRMVDEGITGFAGVPMIFALLLQLRSLDDYDLSKLRYVTNAAAALPLPHVRGLRERFPELRLFLMYGQTECARISCLPPADVDRKPGSVGLPIPGTEFWVVDERGRRAAPNEVGELVVRGGHVMLGYWERPEATALRLRDGPLPGERVLYTGDLCRMDEEGYLFFVSRMDDIIKSRGEKVAPREVESALAGIPGIRECAVIGVPDERLGQALKAFVVPAEGASLTEGLVRLECSKRLEPVMVPKYVVFVPDLPHTSGGKVRKVELE